jgi:hypothetical protein
VKQKIDRVSRGRSAAQACGVLVLSILACLTALGFSTSAWAQKGCDWYGSRPFCDGKCPAGSVYTGQRESCTTGSRRFCCPATAMTRGVNCKWVGRPGSMLHVCEDTEPKKQPRVQPTWAALAVDGKGGWGASIKTDDASWLAEHDAKRRCGSGCRVVMVGKGRCIAFAQSKSGGYWLGHSYGDNRDVVRNIALSGCAKGAPAGTCRVEHVNCL